MCGATDHTAVTAEKLHALRQHKERMLPPEALWDLEREHSYRLDLRAEGGTYDGGFGEWPDEHGETQRIVWNEDASESLPLDSTNDPRARFLAGIATGMTDQVTHPPEKPRAQNA
jgi:hypothetical protein